MNVPKRRVSTKRDKSNPKRKNPPSKSRNHSPTDSVIRNSPSSSNIRYKKNFVATEETAEATMHPDQLTITLTSDHEGPEVVLMTSPTSWPHPTAASFDSDESKESLDEEPNEFNVFENTGKTPYEQFVINMSRSIMKDLSIAIIQIYGD